jgi:hypothetical protein
MLLALAAAVIYAVETSWFGPPFSPKSVTT